MNIMLHKKLGVNPRVLSVCCTVCGQKKDEGLVLLGISNYRIKCRQCGTWVYGGFSSEDNYKCPACGIVHSHKTDGEEVELGAWEQIKTNGVCITCKGYMKQGICLISVKDGEKGDNPFRTGCVAVVKDDAVKRIFGGDGETCAAVMKSRVCFVEDTMWDNLGLPRENIGGL